MTTKYIHHPVIFLLASSGEHDINKRVGVMILVHTAVKQTPPQSSAITDQRFFVVRFCGSRNSRRMGSKLVATRTRPFSDELEALSPTSFDGFPTRGNSSLHSFLVLRFLSY
jgi:hypothetical protein